MESDSDNPETEDGPARQPTRLVAHVLDGHVLKIRPPPPERDWMERHQPAVLNWVFTRPGAVRFEADEPFCHLFPIARGAVQAVSPVMRPLSASPDLERRHREWSQSRLAFNADLATRTKPSPDDWQKSYFRGLQPDGEPGAMAGHRSRLRLKPFEQG